jgi:hypothetical protein
MVLSFLPRKEYYGKLNPEAVKDTGVYPGFSSKTQLKPYPKGDYEPF